VDVDVDVDAGCCSEGLWFAGSRRVSVLVETVRVKGASRPFGIEQVRPLTHTVSTRERRSYRDPAEGSDPKEHFAQAGRFAGWWSQSGPCLGVAMARWIALRGGDGKVGRSGARVVNPTI
jgi:hypothetical protein